MAPTDRITTASWASNRWAIRTVSSAPVLSERGADAPVTVNVEKGTHFQEVIKVQDRLEIIGFEQVRFRIRDAALGNNSSKLRDNR